MKWSPLLVALVAVPVLRVAYPQRSATRGPTVQGSLAGPRYVPVDYDADGRIDAFAIEPTGRGRLLVQMPDGSLLDRTEEVGLASIGGVAGAYWRDLTGDAWPELIVVRPNGTLGLYWNEGQAFSDQTTALEGLVSPPVQVLAFEDYDLDGRFDLGLWGRDGSVQVVLNHGDLVFAPGDIGSTGGRLSLSSLAPASPAVVTAPAPGAGGSSLGTVCADQLVDQATSQCLNASSTPVLGQLYPLTSNLNVDAQGRVGINTTTPTQRLDVSGVVRATGGFQFPDGSIQTTATAVGPAGPPGMQGPEGLPGTQIPAGTILMWGGSVPPSGFLLCDGSLFDPGQYPDLAAVIGTVYGSGVNFRVPDMRQRFPLGTASSGTGSALGQIGGAIDHTHASAIHAHDLAAHTHAAPFHSHTLSHTHSISAHYHSTQGSGADINIISDTSEQHVHDIGGKISSTGSGNTNRFVIADGSGTNNEINAGTGSPPGAAGEHIHGHGAFAGRVGNVASGVNGDGAFTSGGASTSTTSSDSGGQTGVPSINSTGTTTPPNTGAANPPFVTVNFIIKT